MSDVSDSDSDLSAVSWTTWTGNSIPNIKSALPCHNVLHPAKDTNYQISLDTNRTPAYKTLGFLRRNIQTKEDQGSSIIRNGKTSIRICLFNLESLYKIKYFQNRKSSVQGSPIGKEQLLYIRQCHPYA